MKALVEIVQEFTGEIFKTILVLGVISIVAEVGSILFP